ncbi:MAG: gamma-glutamyl-gamma-aminobutyrate hydrolase family protein [bacterium]|nr:gamma-glutamyl-gamma-aminobutyrate hydrolase family protein [bacterium]
MKIKRLILWGGVLFALAVVAVSGFVLSRPLPAGDSNGPKIAMTYGTIQSLLLYIKVDINEAYVTALRQNGGDVIRFTVFDNYETDEKLTRIQGVLLPGGVDVNPALYHEQANEALEETDNALDELEYRVLHYAVDKKLPILGICRGHQILNVFLGGSLYQDIPTQYESTVEVIHRPNGEVENADHDIMIEPDTLLYRILQTRKIKTNSYHHQAVKKMAPNFRPSARSTDGVVEAMEHMGEPFIVGVQFHPEVMRLSQDCFNRLFSDFINAVKFPAGQVRHYGS